mgnify:CR=1 FL=1
MSTIRYILLSILLLLALCPVRAQGEMEVNWSAYAQDSVVPVFAHSIDLGYDYDGTYNVAIEYPELKPLTTNEIARFRLPKRSGAPEWPEIAVYKGVSAKRGQLDVSFSPVIWRDGRYWRIQTFTLKVHREASAKRGRAASGMERYAPHSVLAEGRWVKIRVADNGIYMLRDYDLKQMGFSEPSKVRVYGYGGQQLSEGDPNRWTDDLCEVNVWRGDGRILFYAQGPVSWSMEADQTFTHSRNPYSDYGYYFLTEGEDSQSNALPTAVHSIAAEEPIETTPAYCLYEVDDYAWFHGGRKLVENYDYLNGSVRSYSLQHTFAAHPLHDAALDVCFTHNGSTTTSVAVAMNDVSVGALTLRAIGGHDEAAETTQSFSVDLDEASAQQKVTLTHRRGAGVSGRLDYLRLNYTRFIATNVPIYATSSGIHTYHIGDAEMRDGEDVTVWRITDAPSIEPIAYDKATSTFTADGQCGDVFIAFDTKGTYPVPEVVGEIANQDLHATSAMDYIIIVPSSGKLTAQAERLAALHRAQRGLTVKVVRADEVYNEFSSGTPDATAYRRYLKMLYDRASTADEAPKYLLLFGDGAWDNRMLSPAWTATSPDDYLLCYEAENSFNAVDSYVVEDYFGLLDDGEGTNLKTDKVDVGVGRFPVTTVEQARQMVDKVAAYMNNTHAGAWKNTILMLGDDGDRNRHMDDAELVAQMLESEYPDYMVKRIYWDAFPMEATSTGNSYPVVRKRLLELFKDGALMVNYSGHGAPDVISHELVLNKTDMEELSSPRLPVWVTVSCDITPFDNSELSFGESAFLNPKGGAIGLLTSTRTTYAEQNRRVNYFFSKYAFARDDYGRRLSLGDAVRLAKCDLITTGDASLVDKSGNKLNYVLIGDPALGVGNTDYRMVVDKLNGVSVGSGEEVLLKAGSQVVVQGHVATLGGALATDFSGLLYASVFDNMEDIVCRNNAKEKDADGNVLAPFAYRERTKKFFVGSDSVRNGQFAFTFRVPMDINYSMESGLINFYAIDNTLRQEAKGMFDGFLLGGTEDELTNDGSGPGIQMYLNSPDFVSGGKANETPLFVAKLEDADGINTTGNIGHNLTVIVDGQASMTYNLNEYYLSDIGGYTLGTVSYVLPELPEGKHTLMFRAWDMMNNSSTSTIEFEVVKGLAPEILHVRAILGVGNMIFDVTHDRPENDLEVAIEVFDFSGRILWSHSEQVAALDSNYSYTWNLSCASGKPLDTGVYLYRVIVSSPVGQSTSKAQKIVIRR